MDDTRSTPAALAVGLHHRPRPLVPSSLVPGILALDAGRLSFRTDSGTLFDADPSRASVRLTMFGTLVVTVDGTSFPFVTTPYVGHASPGFSEDQVRVLAAVSPGQVPGLGRRTFSRYRVVGEQRRAFARIVAWTDALAAAGVPTRIRTRSFARSQVVIATIAVPVIVAIVVAVWPFVA